LNPSPSSCTHTSSLRVDVALNEQRRAFALLVTVQHRVHYGFANREDRPVGHFSVDACKVEDALGKRLHGVDPLAPATAANADG